jgi:hypothetical protein
MMTVFNHFDVINIDSSDRFLISMLVEDDDRVILSRDYPRDHTPSIRCGVYSNHRVVQLLKQSLLYLVAMAQSGYPRHM